MHKSPNSAGVAPGWGVAHPYGAELPKRGEPARLWGELHPPRSHSLNAAVRQSRGGRHGSPGFRAGGVKPDVVIRNVRMARSFTAHGTRR